MAGTQVVGKVETLSGDGIALIIRTTGEQVVARPGDILFEGDTIIAADGSSAQVSLMGDHHARVENGTFAQFDSVLIDIITSFAPQSTSATPINVGMAPTPEIIGIFPSVLPAGAGHIVVTTTADVVDALDGETSLREAINMANGQAGVDTITFASGVGEAFENGGRIVLTQGELLATEALTIDGSMAGGTVTLDGDFNSRILNVTANTDTTTLLDLTLTRGLTSAIGGDGGAVWARNDVVIQDSILTGNRITGDFSRGGAVHSAGDLTLTNSTLSSNTTEGRSSPGGAAFSVGSMTITETTFSDNQTLGDSSNGVGAYSNGAMTITNSTFTRNGSLDSEVLGGGVFSRGELTIANSTFASNDNGGAASNSDVTITGSTFSNNYSEYFGRGGGALSYGSLTIDGSTFVNNIATGYYGQGGATFSAGNQTITNSTFAGNGAGQSPVSALPSSGGAAYSVGDLTIVNSTFTGNRHDSGGASAVDAVGAINVTNSILLGNLNNLGQATDQAGLTLSGTNIVGGDVFVGTTDVGDTTLADVFAGTQSFANGLTGGALADNGAPVQTVALKAASANPALDAANASAPAADARGEARVDYPGIGADGSNFADLGAFELNTATETPSLVVTTTADSIDALDGETSLREAIALANGQAGIDTITFAAGAGEAFEGDATIRLTQGELVASEALTIDGSTAGGRLILTGDADADDVVVDGITDVAGSGAALLDDNSRILNVTASSGTVTLQGLILTGGRTMGGSDAGGGIRSNAALNLIDTEVSGNSTLGDGAIGGGIRVMADLTATNSAISGNMTFGQSAYGGGVSSNHDITLTDSTVQGNGTQGYSARGGGLHSLENVSLTGSTVSGNSTQGAFAIGGGIYSFGDVSLISGTLHGNTTVGSYARGGGVFNLRAVYMTNSTVTGNATDGGMADGGGIWSAGGVLFENSIILGNVATQNSSDQLFGPTLQYGTNILGTDVFSGSTDIGDVTASEVFAATFDNNGVEAGVLADNGGPVQTVALLQDLANPALDVASASAPTMDARGEARVDQPGVGNDASNFADLGAFELTAQAETPSLVVTTTDDVVDAFDGQTSLREAVMLAHQQAGADTITFAAGLAGETLTLTNGQFDLSTDLTIDGDVDGDEKADITLDANDLSRVFLISGAADVALESLTLTNGRADYGGNIRITDGTLLLNNSTILNGTANFNGGGIQVDGSNVLMATNTFFFGNYADLYGGAVSLVSGGIIGAHATLTNATLTQNLARYGGGAALPNEGTLDLVNSTVAFNYAVSEGAGIARVGVTTRGDLTLSNSLVLGNRGTNTPVSDVSGNYTSTNSLVGGDEFEVFDMTGAIWADHGGPVQTIALNADLANPALDASSYAAPATDARGEARVDYPSIGNDGNDFADLGAFELTVTADEPSLIVTTNDDVVDAFDGVTSLREAVAFANSNPDASVITFDGPASFLKVHSELRISTDITIDGDVNGDDRPDIILDASSNRFFVTDSLDTDVDFVVQSLMLTNGEGAGVITEGGAILFQGATNTLTVRDSHFVGNGSPSRTDSGGAIHVAATQLLVERSQFEENAADRGGAAISTENSDVTIRDSFFGDNGNGAGTVSITGGTFQIESATLVFNVGPALFLEADGTLTNTTVAGNFNTIGSGETGVRAWATTPGGIEIANSIILGNEDGDFVDLRAGGDSIVEMGPNLIGADATTTEVFSSGFFAMTPDTSGLVPTLELNSASINPALDAGDDMLAPLADARGLTRIDLAAVDNGGTSDLGAFELQGPNALTVEIDASSVSEAAGATATTVTISRNNDVSSPVTVTLVSDDMSEATVQTTATIGAGFESVTVNLDAVDDMDIDGSQVVTITATATDHINGSDTITITDDEIPPPPPPQPANQAPSIGLVGLIEDILRGKDPSQEPTRVVTLQVIDDALGEESFSLSGPDAEFFEISDDTLFFRSGIDLSDRIGTDLAVTVDLDDPSLGVGSEDAVSIFLPVVNTYFQIDGGTVTGTPFADVIEGAEGFDSVVQAGQRNGFTLTFDADGHRLTDRASGVIDILRNIEEVRFGLSSATETALDLTLFGGILDATQAQLEALVTLYVAMFDRAPDAPGLFFWATQLVEGRPMADIIQYFLDSPEFEAAYGPDPDTPSIVRQVYENLLDRAPDAPGEAFWNGALAAEVFGLTEFVLAFVAGAQANAQDRTAIEDQNDIGLYFSVIQGLSDTEDAHDALDVYAISDRDTTLQSAKALIDAFAADIENDGDAVLLMQAVGIVDDPFGTV